MKEGPVRTNKSFNEEGHFPESANFSIVCPRPVQDFVVNDSSKSLVKSDLLEMVKFRFGRNINLYII